MDVDTRLHAFVAAAQEVHDALINISCAGRMTRMTPEKITTQRGPRYIRVIVDGGSPHVFCFVDLRSGEILKAKGWAGPDVKCKTRGNLADDDLHRTALDMHRSLEPSDRARICQALGLPRGRSATMLGGRTAWNRVLTDDDLCAVSDGERTRGTQGPKEIT